MVLVGILAVGTGVYFLLLKPSPPPTPEELVKVALEAASAEKQEQAAAALGRTETDSTEQLLRVMREGKTPEVRAAAIQGLGEKKVWKSMPLLFNTLDDPSPLVRGRSAVAIKTMIGFEYKFRAEDSPEKRQAVVEQMRRDYEVMLQNPPPGYR